MQLLVRLPLLPFTVVFDILFRHGGFAAFADAHGGDGEEAMYQFWRIFFVSSPVGKIHPARIGPWVEAVCACHVVQSLAHPAHAIYLLRPVRREIPESTAAWAVAGGRGNQMLRLEFLVYAMLAFLPAATEHGGLLQREWFSVDDLRLRRSARGWLRFADEIISNHFFTRYWWTRQREGPFHLLGDGSCRTVGEVVARLAQREAATLKARLARDEKANILRLLQQAREKRERKAAAAEKAAAEQREAILRRAAQQTSSFSKKARGPPPASPAASKTRGQPSHQPPPLPPSSSSKARASAPTLSPAHKQEIERLAQARCAKQMAVLSQVRAALSSMRVVTLENNFRRVLCLIVALGREHPLLKWSIKLALHEAALETGRSPWDVERELHRVSHRRDAAPLEKLARLAAERGA